ncbi:unnamed protein product, partial [Mesorhabditis spiculigera]
MSMDAFPFFGKPMMAIGGILALLIIVDLINLGVVIKVYVDIHNDDVGSSTAERRLSLTILIKSAVSVIVWTIISIFAIVFIKRGQVSRVFRLSLRLLIMGLIANIPQIVFGAGYSLYGVIVMAAILIVIAIVQFVVVLMYRRNMADAGFCDPKGNPIQGR